MRKLGYWTLEKTKQENKKRKLELARIQKEETLTRLRQKKISETWNLLPETARRKSLAEEEKRRRLELRETKVNIWKKWRRREDKNPTPSKKESTKQREEENWLEGLEETLARIRQGVEKRNAAKIEEARRRNTLLEDKKVRQEQILRENQIKARWKVKEENVRGTVGNDQMGHQVHG